LGGLGAAIAVSLAGHEVQVLESASEIAEVMLPSHQIAYQVHVIPESLESCSKRMFRGFQKECFNLES
jgi:hypothetical protein